MNKFASLCLLAYKRPQQLKECLQSLFNNTNFPYEIIVHLDGDDSGNSEYLFDLYKNKRISKLLFNAGNNRGVGRSFANCVGVSEGYYIFKIDTDLFFKPNWLTKACEALDDYEVGAVSLFDYRHYDPEDNRFEHYSELGDFLLVDDFVSSIYGFRRQMLELGGYDQDDGFHKKIQKTGKHLAITKKDYVVNSGFGASKSTYVSGTDEKPFKTPTHDTPLIFHNTI